MINFEGYQDTPLYTSEQVRKVIDNIAKTLKLDIINVLFQNKMETLILETHNKDGQYQAITANISLDITTRQPKIIINCKKLVGTWFYNLFEERFNSGQERAAVIYLKRHIGFVTRFSTVLEFIETDHSVISYLMAHDSMTKKIYKVNNIVDNDQIIFELMCFKVFSDKVVVTAESVQDLIENFDKHMALSDMKHI